MKHHLVAIAAGWGLFVTGFSTANGGTPPSQHLLPEEYFPELLFNPSVDPSSNPVAYDARARSILSKDIGHDAFMACLPSFQPEWAIGVGELKAGGGSVVTFREMKRQIWGAKKGSKLTFKQTVAPIDDRTAAMIRQCWERMLRETRYDLPSEDFGLDGETYHFSSGGGMSGYVWSPSTDTLPGRFVGLADTLREFATAVEANRPKLIGRIRSEADELYRGTNNWNDRILRNRDDAVLSFLSHRDCVLLAVFSPDEKRLLTGARKKDAIVWDASSGEPLARFRGNNDDVNGGAFSPDGKLVVTTSTGGNVTIWDSATGKELRHLGTDRETAGSAAFSPDGKTIVTGQKGGAKLWDVQTGKMIRMFPIGGVFAYDVAFSHNGAAVLTGGGDGRLRIFNAANDSETLQFSADAEQITRVLFSTDDSQILSVANYRRVKVWDAKSGKLEQSFGRENQSVVGAAFTVRGLYVATEDDSHNIHVWEGEKELIELQGHTMGVTCGDFTRDGNRLVTCGKDQTAKLWKLH